MSNACRLHYAPLHVRVEACCLSVTPLGIDPPTPDAEDCRETLLQIKQLKRGKNTWCLILASKLYNILCDETAKAHPIALLEGLRWRRGRESAGERGGQKFHPFG